MDLISNVIRTGDDLSGSDAIEIASLVAVVEDVDGGVLVAERYVSAPEKLDAGDLRKEFGVVRSDVEQVDLIPPLCGAGQDALDELFHQNLVERIEEEDEQKLGWQAMCECVGLVDMQVLAGMIGSQPDGHIFSRDLSEFAVEFDPFYLLEGEFGGEHHYTAFSATDIEKGVLFQAGVGGEGGLPKPHQRVEEGWCGSPICLAVALMDMLHPKLSTRDETTCIDSVTDVEGMLDGGAGPQLVINDLAHQSKSVWKPVTGDRLAYARGHR